MPQLIPIFGKYTNKIGFVFYKNIRAFVAKTNFQSIGLVIQKIAFR